MSADERARVKKQMADQAVKLAISSQWREAANVNRDYLKTFGEEPDASNRLGKALSELGQVTEARAAYARSLELDPTNTIARRNLDRLALMRDTAPNETTQSQVDTRIFVEETGKSTTAALQAVDADIAKQCDPGDVVELKQEGNVVNVMTTSGGYIGMLSPRVGLRLSKMMAGGNQYAAAIVTTGGEVRVMLRETFQHPSMIGKVSFPQSRTTDVRGYTRRGLLRGDVDETDYTDDDEPEDEPDDDGWSEASDDMDDNSSTTSGMSIDTDDESFD
jgi:hypothetical protein